MKIENTDNSFKHFKGTSFFKTNIEPFVLV